MVCSECGKPCRTEAEQTLHTRANPGHNKYVEKTEDATVDTEKQMQEARSAMDVDDDSDVIAGTLKKKKASTADDGEVALVPAVVDEKLLKEMEEMGFPTNRAIRAIYHSNASEVEAAVNWVVEHEGDANIDEPLLVPQGTEVKEKLSPEEARQKAEELVRKAREKREKEERELELHRERERIRAGKELQAAKRKEDETALQRLVEARKREKEEEARAREKLRLQLEEDRRERRRKLGLPEELTEEEKAKEAERLEKQRQEQEAKKAFTYVKPVSMLDKLRNTLVSMKKGQANPEAFKLACSLLVKYIGNIASNPDEDKYRSIKLTNATFQQKVAVVQGSEDFLQLCGFEKAGEALTMPREKVNIELLNLAGSELNNAITNPFFGAL